MDSQQEPPDPARISNDVTDDGAFASVRDGYDAVYDALAGSATFNRIWRSHAYNGEFPVEFAHIGFLTLGEANRMLAAVQVGAGDTLVDVACGGGGPGLWAAQQAGAMLVGVDPSAAGIGAARERARDVGLDARSAFRAGNIRAHRAHRRAR